MELLIGLRTLLARLAGLVNQGATLVCHLCVAVMTISILLQVFCRYVLNASLIWPEEVSIFLMVWMVFVGASVALRRGEHVAVGVFTDRLGPQAGAVAHILSLTVVLALSCILLVTAWRVAWLNREIISDALQISMFWPKLGVPMGALCLVIQSLHLIAERVGKIAGGEAA